MISAISRRNVLTSLLSHHRYNVCMMYGPSTSYGRASPLSKRVYLRLSTSVDEEVVEKLRSGLKSGVRAALARSITLVESTHPRKRANGDLLLKLLLEDARKQFKDFGSKSLVYRIGISGAPGVGKSTFIEALGKYLIGEKGMSVAVLTVDPSSKKTGGSLLGDLTRMPELAVNSRSYVRSSPSHGTLGGVSRGTQEGIILCEAAGYDVVLVETVGGDELQGVKRGVMELADILCITKSDGDLMPQSRRSQADYMSALKYFRPRSPNWRPPVLPISSVTGYGLKELWQTLEKYWKIKNQSGEVVDTRRKQLRKWMWRHLEDQLISSVKEDEHLKDLVVVLEREVEAGLKTPGQAAEILYQSFRQSD